MAMLVQIICCIFLLNITLARHTSIFDKPILSSYFDDVFDDDWFSSSKFDDFDDIFEKIEKQFEKFDNIQSIYSKINDDEMNKIKSKLDAVTPVCNTTDDTTTIIPNNTQKQFYPTKTTVCFKELIDGRMRYIHREIKVTDDQGRILSQNNAYKSFTINALNDISPSKRLD